MRPTGIGFRSPKEKTPDFYASFVSLIPAHLILQTNYKGDAFFELDAYKGTQMRLFAEKKAGFGKEDRFQYRELAEKMVACGEMVGPATYDANESLKKM